MHLTYRMLSLQISLNGSSVGSNQCTLPSAATNTVSEPTDISYSPSHLPLLILLLDSQGPTPFQQ